ncbi:MAG: GyrI-like domain-containing protein [Candidatus Kapaibacterium sp.]
MKKNFFIVLFAALVVGFTVPTYAEAEVDIEVTQFDGATILAVKDSTVNMQNIGEKLGQAYGEIMQYGQNNGIEFTGAPVAVTYEFDMQTYKWIFAAGIPFESTGDFIPSGRIFVESIPASKVVKAVVVGPYEDSETAYTKIGKYMEENGLEENGNSWEEYISDPTNTPPEELVTHIYFPVK